MDCTLHNTVEIDGERGPIYPYRCSRCGNCFVCGHTLIGYSWWVCKDGVIKPTTFDEGVKVPQPKW